MQKFEITEELKSMILFSGAGVAMGGVSSILGVATYALPAGIAALVGIRKGAEKLFLKDGTWLNANGLIPYLTFWYLVWVLAINI
ncbi:MAG: hypothetical protein ABIF85_00470 [Nanoarchaeota archaeon]|nr:hypothetical protein [Nanoarchaeota archaeon]MBU4300656.1 hypothetical protein [Nanoarchaeota archaeon]MBU4452482.1 hypothetical protein [Nanoarchaeota archaeon]MCG2723441.1 hypothetical protein [archaeon]